MGEILKNYPDQFRVDYALSREQQNKDGGKMYIQDKVEEYGEEFFQLLQEGAIIYFCGLKGMIPASTTCSSAWPPPRASSGTPSRRASRRTGSTTWRCTEAPPVERSLRLQARAPPPLDP